MKPRVDKAAAAVALLLAGVAGVILWQSRGFTAFASIFPRAVGTVLLLCCLGVLWRLWRRPSATVRPLDVGAWLRSGALVAVMVGWVAMLETAGFTLSSVIGFLLLGLITDRGPLRAARLLGLVLAALLFVLAMQLLFQRGLDVRLPAGEWLPNLFN